MTRVASESGAHWVALVDTALELSGDVSVE